MAIAFVQGGAASADAGNPLAVTLTGVTAGNAICIGLGWESASSTCGTIVDSGGAGSNSTFVDSALNAHNTGGEPIARFSYTLNATRSGTVTYTATRVGTPSFMRMHVAEFSFADAPLAPDQTDVTAEGSSSGTLSSAAITTTGTNEIVFGFLKGFTGLTITSPTIGGVAGAFVGTNQSDTAMWYRVATISSGVASVSVNNSDRWILPIISFKDSGGGGGGPVIPVFMNQYRQRR